MSDKVNPKDILDFWKNAGGKKWFSKDDSFDEEIREKFGHLIEPAANGKLDHWMENPDDCLALILVLDQFSRNLFRNSAKAFAQDDKALEVANFALAKNYDDKTDKEMAVFFYMPLEHSEDLEDQKRCMELMRKTGNSEYVKYAQIHYDIIEKFGRFPHRNKVLGRETTKEEQAFLDDGGFSG